MVASGSVFNTLLLYPALPLSLCSILSSLLFKRVLFFIITVRYNMFHIARRDWLAVSDRVKERCLETNDITLSHPGALVNLPMETTNATAFVISYLSWGANTLAAPAMTLSNGIVTNAATFFYGFIL